MTRSRLHRFAVVCVLLFGSCILPRRADAEPSHREECSFAYESAQVARRDGDLIGAKKKLQFCGGFDCPNVMHRDCQQWLSEVEASIPTVVFQLDTQSEPAQDGASISIDGATVTALDARAIAVNPGRHKVTISAAGFSPVSKVFTILEGEKLRREVIALLPERKPVRPRVPARDEAVEPLVENSTGSRFTLPIIVASAVAVVGGAGAFYWGLSARDNERRLGACSPNCDHAAVDAAKRDYLLANVSIGVAGAGVLAAAVLAVVVLKSPNKQTQARLGLVPQPNALPGISLLGNF